MSAVKTRIMYIQRGRAPGGIGRVRSSKTGRTIFYGDVELASLGGRGYEANYIDSATNEQYWVSGPRKDGQDTLYPGSSKSTMTFVKSTGSRFVRCQRT
jgi:hypothetical protein